jgi:hypothetical protein
MVQQAWFKDASFIEKKLLCWQDAKDNTLLHVAVAKNLTKVSNFHSSFLVEEDRVGKMEIYHVVQRGDS